MKLETRIRYSSFSITWKGTLRKYALRNCFDYWFCNVLEIFHLPLNILERQCEYLINIQIVEKLFIFIFTRTISSYREIHSLGSFKTQSHFLKNQLELQQKKIRIPDRFKCYSILTFQAQTDDENFSLRQAWLAHWPPGCLITTFEVKFQFDRTIPSKSLQ